MFTALRVVCVSSAPGSQPRRSAEIQQHREAAHNAGRRLEGRMAALKRSNPTGAGLSFRNRSAEACNRNTNPRETAQAFAVDVSGFELDELLDSDAHVTEDAGNAPPEHEAPCGDECHDFYARGYTLRTPVFDQVSELRAVDHRSLQKLKVPTHRLWF